MAITNRNRLLEKYVQVVRMDGLNTNKNVNIGINGSTASLSLNGVTQGSTQTLASSATITLTPTSTVLSHTPTQSETINFVSPANYIGAEIFLVVTTSGSSSYTLTFGTNAKSTGTLATGTSTGKVFVICFLSDGTNWNEVSRTTAM